ncbi:HDR089Wp [Eremothecium sinecaudum]|uniref:Translocation protein SEC62 n=1 Tax=Eremothecium sinecaudum TaxID=45286 RepID=A0A0X8HS41_9SACH|nr:HDR089Wp [Eremothecium sinecaudum]AMD20831.1 HDR089Wp [Eremothecium sinecaudum]
MSESSSPLLVGALLRHHKELKQRQGLYQSRHMDFFRYKRFVRALKSPEYHKKSQEEPELYPPVKTDDDAREVFVSLIKSQVVVPCKKLHSSECKENGLKPDKDYPNLLLSDKATLEPDEYYVWMYTPKTWLDYVTVIGVIVGILVFVCYPLWPSSMKRLVYYLSLGLLALIGLFFGIAVIRLFVYVLSLAMVSEKGGLWIFPNLFEDCGVLDSFKPLYGYGETECYSYIKKMKRKKKNIQKN